MTDRYLLDADFVSKYFTWEEFACRCKRPECDARVRPMGFFLMALERARAAYGKPMHVSSWSRCKYWNKKVGGAALSEHLDANAVDIFCHHSLERWQMIKALMDEGFTIKVYDGWIHADLRVGNPLFL